MNEWKVVPVEPTGLMVDAGRDAIYVMRNSYKSIKHMDQYVDNLPPLHKQKD